MNLLYSEPIQPVPPVSIPMLRDPLRLGATLVLCVSADSFGLLIVTHLVARRRFLSP